MAATPDITISLPQIQVNTTSITSSSPTLLVAVFPVHDHPNNQKDELFAFRCRLSRGGTVEEDQQIPTPLTWEVKKTTWQVKTLMGINTWFFFTSNIRAPITAADIEHYFQTTPTTTEMLEFLELSQATMQQQREDFYEEPPKLYEGWIWKANGGFETYSRSKRLVLITQFISAALAGIAAAFHPSHTWSFVTIFFLTSTILSLSHWLFYRLEAIDATCLLPCSMLPPVGPFLILAWFLLSNSTLYVNYTRRWFIIRPWGVVWYEDAWGSTTAVATTKKPKGVVLFERGGNTIIHTSFLSRREFRIQTPHRCLTLVMSSSHERTRVVNILETQLALLRDRDNVVVSAQWFVDGQSTFAAIYKAISQAQKEIFIAAWMLTPELRLLRPQITEHELFESRRIPFDDAITSSSSSNLFNRRPSTTHVALLPGIPETSTLFVSRLNGATATCYDLYVISTHQDVSWTLRARASTLEEWVDIDIRKHVSLTPPSCRFRVSTEVEARQWEICLSPVDEDGDYYFAASDFLKSQVMLTHIDLFEHTTTYEPCGDDLQTLLARKTDEGVRVCVLLYRDLPLWLPNASAAVKDKLLAKSRGKIQVLRHAPAARASGAIQHLWSCGSALGDTWWSHHEKLVVVDQSLAFFGGLDLCVGRFDNHTHSLHDFASHIWHGQDYNDSTRFDFSGLDFMVHTDTMKREKDPRSPWHDVHACVGGHGAIEVAKFFIASWNTSAKELGKLDKVDLLIPRVLDRRRRQSGVGDGLGYVDVQCRVLRSMSLWSSGATSLKSSSEILDAYISTIRAARQFIYIEQQFFISSCAGDGRVRNDVGRALVERVMLAATRREPFVVYIVVPVLPAFAGGAALDNPSARSVAYWVLSSIRGLYDELGSVVKTSTVVSVRFFTLRKTSRWLNGELRNEQIYVHSKLMIVDDEVAMLGSANLNDRSLLGNRDSELACLLTSTVFVKELRMYLFREHLGMLAEQPWTIDIDDPMNGAFANWARHNTMLIENAFTSCPSNRHGTLDDFRQSLDWDFANPVKEFAFPNLLAELRGHVCDYPVDFLRESAWELLPRWDREAVLPIENYT